MLHARNSFDTYSPLPVSLATPLGAAIDRPPVSSSMLDRYLEGWAEADPAKIRDATDPGYIFHDPLVGRFSRGSLAQYFEQLRLRFAGAGEMKPRDLSFRLHGPMDSQSLGADLQFWREAPHIGLTGPSYISAGPRGVRAESVAYEASLASYVLCGSRL
jgi:hypothetical protein